MQVTILPVQDSTLLRQFVKLPYRIYQNDAYWVPPLISEDMRVMDPKRGTFYKFGRARLFLAFRDDKPVGRISAHVNDQYARYHDNETGFFGFFECINDQAIADTLFKEAATWLKSQGKRKIMGPMSFSIYDISGMLYDGFDSSPVILLAYNAQYYNDLVSAAGFTKAIDWYAFMIRGTCTFNPTLYKVRDRLMRQSDIEIVSLNMKDFDMRVKQVGHIFSEAWMENWGHVPLTEHQLKDLAAELKLVCVPELTYFAIISGKCIGFSLTIKDMNPALKKANGRLYPFGLLKILLASRKIKRLRTIAMGVLKEHRHRGIDIVFYLNTLEKARALGYKESECSIIVETNDRMIRALEDLSAKRYKTYRFYEKPI